MDTPPLGFSLGPSYESVPPSGYSPFIRGAVSSSLAKSVILLPFFIFPPFLLFPPLLLRWVSAGCQLAEQGQCTTLEELGREGIQSVTSEAEAL
jgi:hypothetical protein